MMATTMAREAWTDGRLDDLNVKVGDGFAGVDVRFDRLEARFEDRFDKVDSRSEAMDARWDARFGRMEQRFDSLQLTLAGSAIALVVALIGLIAAIVATQL
jgi:hypothetical protein